MIKTLPLRLTILHLAQRFRIDGETFISKILLAHGCSSQQTAKSLIIYFHSSFVQITRNIAMDSRDSQDKRFSFGDSHRMFKMCCQ
jgi:hypothetical protein